MLAEHIRQHGQEGGAVALERRTPMPRGGPLRQVSPRRAASADGPLWSTLTRTPFRPSAVTGTVAAQAATRWKLPRRMPDPVGTKVRAQVHARSGDRCEICGCVLQPDWRSIQHRQRRGQGGGHDVTNLLDVCGPNAGAGCHFASDEGPDRLVNGWQVRSGDSPALVPVLLAGGRRVLLTPDGRYEAVSVDP